MRVSLFLQLIFLTAALFACSTMPKDAPVIFEDAAASLKRADKEDADDYLPKTMKQAENDLDKARSMWVKKEKNDSAETIQNRREDAISLATKSKELSSGALALTKNLQQWDSDLTTLEGEYSIPDLISQVKTLQRERDLQSSAEIEPRFAKLQGVRLHAPVAYFDTDSAVLDPYYREGINELAGLLQQESGLVVAISGYADPRGPENYNMQLSSARAKAVAAQLQEKGVVPARLKIIPMGEKVAHFKTGVAKLQLERRVDMTISPGAASISE